MCSSILLYASCSSLSPLNILVFSNRTPDAVEVFSRTQGVQHWHIAKREPNLSLVTDMNNAPATDSVGGDAIMYMEISRKETSLADVDNELAEVVRKATDGRWMRKE